MAYTDIQDNILYFYQNSRLKNGYLIIMAGQSNSTDRYTISGNLPTLLQGIQPNLMVFYKTANTIANNGSWIQANSGVNTTTGGGISGNYGIGLVIANRLINNCCKAGYLVTTGIGGTAIDNTPTTSWNVSHNTGVYSQDLYARFVNHVTQAIAAIPAGITLTPVVVWVHQEADSYVQSYANNYQTNLTNLINQARIDLGLPDLKFVITKLRSDFDPTAAYQSTVKSAVNNIVSGLSNTYLYDTDTSLTPLSIDLQHYNPTVASYSGTQSVYNLGNGIADLISTF